MEPTTSLMNTSVESDFSPASGNFPRLTAPSVSPFPPSSSSPGHSPVPPTVAGRDDTLHAATVAIRSLVARVYELEQSLQQRDDIHGRERVALQSSVAERESFLHCAHQLNAIGDRKLALLTRHMSDCEAHARDHISRLEQSLTAAKRKAAEQEAARAQSDAEARAAVEASAESARYQHEREQKWVERRHELERNNSALQQRVTDLEHVIADLQRALRPLFPLPLPLPPPLRQWPTFSLRG